MSTGSDQPRPRRLPRPRLPKPRLPKKPEFFGEDPLGVSGELARVSINRMVLIATGVGVITGLLVALLNWTVLLVERAVYGVDHYATRGPALHVAPERATITILVLGLVLSWVMWLYQRLGPNPVAIGAAIKGTPMPVIKTLLSGFIQVVSVAVGAPVGRENAPRLVGALSASRAAVHLRLDAEARRLLIASAAGAGLAATFHLPLAGALFALELLLRQITARSVVVAMVTSAVAVATTGLFIEAHPVFHSVPLNENASMILAAIIVGSITGVVGHVFGQAARIATEYAPQRGNRILWQMPLGYAFIAGAVWLLPQLAGNNRWAAGTTLAEALPLTLLLSLAGLRMLTYLIALRVGTIGGMLTPAFAIGALIGAILGTLLSPWFPGVSVEAFALLGAAAFLSTAMVAPLFGMIAAVEFTDMVAQGYLPVFVSVVAAAVAVRLLGVAATRRAPYVQGTDPEESRSQTEAESQHHHQHDDADQQRRRLPRLSTSTAHAAGRRKTPKRKDGPSGS